MLRKAWFSPTVLEHRHFGWLFIMPVLYCGIHPHLSSGHKIFRYKAQIWLLDASSEDTLTEAIARPFSNGQEPPFSFWSGQIHPHRMGKKGYNQSWWGPGIQSVLSALPKDDSNNSPSFSKCFETIYLRLWKTIPKCTPARRGGIEYKESCRASRAKKWDCYVVSWDHCLFSWELLSGC